MQNETRSLREVWGREECGRYRDWERIWGGIDGVSLVKG